eukprot:6473615-Amphidinium_carterae.3
MHLTGFHCNVIGCVQHKWRCKVQSTEHDALTLREEIAALVAEHLSPEEIEHVQGESAILRTRHQALVALFGGVKELADFCSGFSRRPAGFEDNASSSTAGPGKVAHSVGSGPPCASYLDLKTFKDCGVRFLCQIYVAEEIRSVLTTIHLADSKEECDTFKESIRNFLAPTKQLISQCRCAKKVEIYGYYCCGGKADYEKRRKTFQDKALLQAKKRKLAGQQDRPMLFEKGGEVFAGIATVRKD